MNTPPATTPTGRPAGPTPRAATVPPNIQLVQLGPGFSPATIELSTGQQFPMTVNTAVQASIPGGCPPGRTTQITGRLLTLQCTDDGGYLHTAERPGPATLVATVRPQCTPGTLCPQWTTMASLQIMTSL